MQNNHFEDLASPGISKKKPFSIALLTQSKQQTQEQPEQHKQEYEGYSHATIQLQNKVDDDDKKSNSDAQKQSELDQLVTSFASPISDNIFMQFDTKTKHTVALKDQASNLENVKLKGPVFREFTIHIFQAISFLQNLPEISMDEINSKAFDFKFKKPGFSRIVIFDLDETLAHYVRPQAQTRTPDVYLNITLASGSTVPAGFNIRPYCKELLEEVNKHYEVVVFTASNQLYADTVIDHIDPEKKYIQHRLYRESCVKTQDNVYVKDLRIFRNIDLKDIVLVDNAVYSFGRQLDNGIPITPFSEDQNDTEFLCLKNYLKGLNEVQDFRESNKAAFQMDKVYQFNLDNYIDYYNYEECTIDSDDERYADSPMLRQRNRLPKQVESCLDEIQKIMKKKAPKKKRSKKSHRSSCQ